jgi:hypothetical protein
MLLVLGGVGVAAAVFGGTLVLVARLLGAITLPGYAPVVLAITFFGGLTTLALGVVGQYVRLALENARRRPNFIIQNVEESSGQESQDSRDRIL